MLKNWYHKYDVTIMDMVLIVCTGGAWLLWIIPRNIYRRDRNKKYALTWYQTHRAIRKDVDNDR